MYVSLVRMIKKKIQNIRQIKVNMQTNESLGVCVRITSCKKRNAILRIDKDYKSNKKVPQFLTKGYPLGSVRFLGVTVNIKSSILDFKVQTNVK